MGFDMDQQRAYDLCTSGENVYISGVGGVGKTFVIRKVADNWRKQGKKVVICSFSRQAAINLDSDRGITIFKAFNTFPGGLAFDEEGINRLKRSEAWNADVIIIDEISMCPKLLFSYVCKAIRRISLGNNHKDIALIVIGDFLQLPPTAKRGETIEYAFESGWWRKCDFKYAVLETPHRQHDREYFNHLCQIRRGLNIKENIEYLKTHAHYLQKKEDAVTLCSYRDDVKAENLKAISKLPGKAKEYWVRTNSEKFMDSLGVWDCLPLKINTLVMTTYNDPMNRFHNGATGKVVELSEEKIKVEFFDSTPEKPHIEEIGYHRWTDSADIFVEQLPIIPAHSITIHKAQGCSLDYMNVNPRCFANGQFYVAISRVRDVSHLYITGEIRESDIKVCEKVMVFYEHFYSVISSDEERRKVVS